MKVLTAYIVKEVLKGSVIALLLLLTLFNLFTLSDELKDVGKGTYDVKQVFQYIALTSPRVLFELIPSAALLGSLFVVGGMGNSREIVAMRAAGVSVFWIIRAVMLAGLVLVVFAIAIGEFVAPEAERAAQIIKTTAQNNEVVMDSKYGMWFKEGNRFINVRKIEQKGVLSDIYTYEIDGNGRLAFMRHTGRATFAGNNLWKTERIQQLSMNAKSIRAKDLHTLDWRTTINPDLLKVVVVKSENMSLYDLFMYIQFLKKNSQKSQSFELAFWSRLINPFVTFVMLMVSIPFVIGVKRGVGVGGRMMMGIIIGMTFNIFDKIAGHMGLVYGYNPLMMAVLPSAIVFLTAAYIVRRAQ
ncbi:MAG: LPS export ABC transporter permease LptG [Methylococcales bacterium]|nr:LPS export ABC transporter permease LptG [Methylococcales bacterium]